MTDYQLREAPKKEISIAGKTYALEIGNFTFVLGAQAWVDALQSVRDGGNDMFARLSELSAKGYELVAMALGEDAANELVGGENSVNILRVLDVLDITVREATDASASAALTAAIADIAETDDKD